MLGVKSDQASMLSTRPEHAVCLTGLYRIPIIDRIVSQYAAVDARFFVVTDAEEARNWTWATNVQILPRKFFENSKKKLCKINETKSEPVGLRCLNDSETLQT